MVVVVGRRRGEVEGDEAKKTCALSIVLLLAYGTAMLACQSTQGVHTFSRGRATGAVPHHRSRGRPVQTPPPAFYPSSPLACEIE